MKDFQLNGGCTYDPSELATSETDAHANYGQFDQMRHMGPANRGLQDTGFAQPVGETGYNQSQLTAETCFNQPHLEYVSQDAQLSVPRGIAVKLPHPHDHFHSKLHPPTLYHHTTHPSQHHSSTLPPIHLHTNISGGGGEQLRGVPKAPQALSKLPTIVHGRSKTYAGRSNRMRYLVNLMMLINVKLRFPIIKLLLRVFMYTKSQSFLVPNSGHPLQLLLFLVWL